jgi:hypothetical protein
MRSSLVGDCASARSRVDPDNVLVIHHFETVGVARAFFANPDLLDAMRRGGVKRSHASSSTNSPGLDRKRRIHLRMRRTNRPSGVWPLPSDLWRLAGIWSAAVARRLPCVWSVALARCLPSSGRLVGCASEVSAVYRASGWLRWNDSIHVDDFANACRAALERFCPCGRFRKPSEPSDEAPGTS